MDKQTLDTGHGKIQQICNALRTETLEPAKKEAETIIANAQKKAEEIIKEAEARSQAFLLETKRQIEQEKNVLESSLFQAGRQGLEALRQTIEHKLFNPSLHDIVQEELANPQVIAKLITALIAAIEKEGTTLDIEVFIPSQVSPQEVNQLIGKKILDRLKKQSVSLGDFEGGAKITLKNKQLSLEISNKEIEEILRRYLRKEFRSVLFQGAN